MMKKFNFFRLFFKNLTATWYLTKIVKWHYDRNLINGSTAEKQIPKLEEEFNELKDSMKNGQSIIDDIGDMTVVMANIVEQYDLTYTECLKHAYNEIKDRKGKMVNGIFVKESE